jgi:deazaflavin-dependent oxidoreductase (nitroreductase family)
VKGGVAGFRDAVTGYPSNVTVNQRNRPIVEEFRTHHGHVGGPFEGIPLLLLHNRGAKTGEERINPVAYQRLDGGAVAVFASYGGNPRNPDWYYNVVAHPDVEVEIADDSYPARARVARGEERTRIWEAQKAALPQFAEYERRTRGHREIPVVVLEPA